MYNPPSVFLIPAPASPKPPPLAVLFFPPAPFPTPHPERIHRDAQSHEPQHHERLHGLGKHRSREQKQADAAEDHGGANPSAVGPFQERFAHAQYDQSEDGEEVERVTRYAVEGDQGAELADDDVRAREQRVQHQRVDRREPQPAILVPDHRHQPPLHPAPLPYTVSNLDSPRHPDPPQRRRQEAFLSSGVDEPSGGEGCGVESAEAGRGDDEGEEERAQRAEDPRAEGDGDCVGGGDEGEREHEDVGDVGEQVGGDDEGHGGVDDAGEIAGRVEEFAGDEVGLLAFFSVLALFMFGFFDGLGMEPRIKGGKKKRKGIDGIFKGGPYIIPTIIRPQPRIQRDGPTRSTRARALEPALRLPILVGRPLPRKPRGSNHDPDDRNAEQRDEFQKHQGITHARGQPRGEAVQ